MFTEERRERILELLNTDGRVIAKELAERFDMSIDSIRRDLSIMEKDGLLKRTHGGAIELTRVRNLVRNQLNVIVIAQYMRTQLQKLRHLIYKKMILFLLAGLPFIMRC